MRPPSVPQPDFGKNGKRKTNARGEDGWSLRIWDGRTNRQRERTVYGTQRQAAAALEAMRAEIVKATGPALPRAQYVTVEQWAVVFLREYLYQVPQVDGAGGILRPETTWKNARANLSAYIGPMLTDEQGRSRRMVSVTEKMLTRAIAGLKVTDHSLPGKPKSKPADPDTLDKAASITRLFFASAVPRVLDSSPAAGLRTVWGIRARAARVVIPSLVQVEALADALDAEWPGMGDVVRVFAYTGLRWENLTGLLWEDVDVEHRSILVRRSRPSSTGQVVERLKGGGDDEFITIIDEAVEPLRRLRALADKRGSATVVCGLRGGMLSYALWRGHLKKARAASGVPYTAHGLRHCCISLLIAGGAPIELVRQQAMHKTTQTTQRVYRHAIMVDRRELAGRLRMPTTGIEVDEAAEKAAA
jgi:integrase